LEQLNWQQIPQRFIAKINSADEQFFQLTITAKNFTERLKNLPIMQRNNLYNYDKVCVPLEWVFSYWNGYFYE
jgi:hypothetical protein